MERIEYCTVHARKKNRYYVKIVKNAKCEGCKACGFGRKNHLILPALSQIECETGDSVAVAMPEKQVKGSFVFIPFAAFVLICGAYYSVFIRRKSYVFRRCNRACNKHSHSIFY